MLRGPCGRTVVPYRPLDAPMPSLEQTTDPASGARSYRTSNGVYYPSVTTVLGATAPKAAVRDWQNSVGMDVARHIAGTQAAVGTEVHERLSLYVRGLDPWQGYQNEWDRPIDVRGHYDQLVRFACSRLQETTASEAAAWSDGLRVAGSIDLVAVLDDTWGDASGKRAVVDFKCLRSPPAPDKTATYLAQCAAYAAMWTERTGQAIERVVVAQSIGTGGVRLAIDEPGGGRLDAFVKRRVEFDRLGLPLPGRDYVPDPEAVSHAGAGGAPGNGGGRNGMNGNGDSNGRTRPFVVWMTGLPSSGKTTILRELVRMVPRMVPLDSDTLREWFTASDYTRAGRARHIVRIARLASHLCQSGVPVGVATCSPYPENRQAARGIIEDGTGGAYLECYVRCPRRVCESRDRHGLYERARAGHLEWFTGIDDPYIPPESPDVVLDTERDDAEASALRVVQELRARRLLLWCPNPSTGMVARNVDGSGG